MLKLFGTCHTHFVWYFTSLQVRLPSNLVASKNDLEALEFVDVGVLTMLPVNCQLCYGLS